VGADATVSTARLGLANGIAGAAIAILAPLLGAVADRAGRRKAFLLAFTTLGIASTAALWFVGQGDWQAAALWFVLGSMGFLGAIVFYDALLLDVAAPHELDRVSSFGYALGYLGGGLLFALNVLAAVKPAWFGLPDAAAAVRVSFLSVAVWWLVFSIPLLRDVHEPQSAARVPIGRAVREGLGQLVQTVRHILGYRELTLFLVAYWLYIDGVNTVIKMAVDFGLSLGLPASSLLAALLLTQFVAFPAALAFGWLGDRIGAQRGILIGLAVYSLATLAAFGLDTVTEFYALAVVIGLVQGGVQALSRSYFGRLVPAGRNAEFFGFYNMVGKFATVIGPLLVGAVALWSGSSRASIASLVVLFVAGGVLLALIPRK
jgi:UMF1 family MFS transporter